MGANKAAQDAMKYQAKMTEDSLNLQKATLAQPKASTSDNFAANKLKEQNRFRLGIASTISAPMVNSMKTKLGV